ncbi:hypothetical protein SEUCBS139899_001238 [Sporothrix eucalyptigena]|uniref:PWWP domain-containing protein n=1 Tax=Sporothrix eucalyptigena TaxID=1812306 RepID=A0ABP0BRU6_9PEZI
MDIEAARQYNLDLSSSSISPSDLLQAGVQRSALYQRALTELQELEAEPLCHRIAARLLINNCQILDGKDDATVHTDSGRRARDFVDSYAASLAICDLERASFSIPTACEPFRQRTLSQIPLSDSTAQLHVPEAQIRACLASLGESPSAWNTWVSYSHKAVRFCEAARADHEKTQNVLVFQKLTRVMAKLTDDVEAELQKNMDTWTTALQDATERLDQLYPTAVKIVNDIGILLETQLKPSVSETMKATMEGFRSAETLQQLLAVMAMSAMESNSEIAFAHEQSLELIKQRTNSELDQVSAVVQRVFSSAVSLQKKIELSQLQVTELTSRQASLEKGIVQLQGMANTFMADFQDHAYFLAKAKTLTNDMLDTIEATVAATSTIQNMVWTYLGLASWWPYIVCPVISLIAGSYGLPPSILRNFGLLTLGELAAVAISSYSYIREVAGVFLTFRGMANNMTAPEL